MELAARFRRKEAMIGIIGMGYVGLPLMREFCRAGFKVLGFDIDPEKVAQLNRGESYIQHIPATLIRRLLAETQFEATTDFSRLREVQAIIICVPTPLTAYREPDLSFVRATTAEIASHLQPGQLIVLESTTYPGTTQEVLRPILEQGGLRGEEDFFLAYSPEREDPGNPQYSTHTIPKVVGAIGPRSLECATALYEQAVVKVVPVSGPQEAEACKILENIYRAVNIALINELKMLFHAMDINIWEVIQAAATKPFGYHPFYPGPGLGGHCIPIDPFYLTWKARQYEIPTRFIELAGEINTAMPGYVINRLVGALNEQGKALKGANILVLGVAYKRDVDDIRESPALKIIELLLARKARVSYHDPYIPKFPSLRRYPDIYMESVSLTDQVLQQTDAVLIVTDHSNYDYQHIFAQAPLVVDTRGVCQRLGLTPGNIVEA